MIKLIRYRWLLALCLLLVPFLSIAGTTGFFVAYDQDNADVGNQGIIAHLIRIQDIDAAEPQHETFKLHLTEGEHKGAMNRQYLTRLGAINKNQPVFLCPNGHIYIFNLSRRPQTSDYYKPEFHAYMSQDKHGCPEYKAQFELNAENRANVSGMASTVGIDLGREYYSPMSMSAVFSTPDNKKHFIVASDEYSFIIDVPSENSGDTAANATEMNIHPFPQSGNRVMENPQVSTYMGANTRRYMSTGIDFVKDSSDQYHLVASLDSTKRETERVDNRRAFILYQLDLKSEARTWTQTAVSTASVDLPREYDQSGTILSTNTGDIFDFCVDNTCTRASFQIHHHTRAILKNVIAEGQQNLTNGNNLGYMKAPESTEYKDLSATNIKHDRFMVMIRPYEKMLYSVVAHANQTQSNYHYTLMKANWPESLSIRTPEEPEWMPCCAIGELPASLHPRMFEQFYLLSTEEKPIQIGDLL